LRGHHHGLDEAAAVGAVLVRCEIEDIGHLGPFPSRCIAVRYSFVERTLAKHILRRQLPASIDRIGTVPNIFETMYRNKKHLRGKSPACPTTR
jgi:hypothetical protein